MCEEGECGSLLVLRISWNYTSDGMFILAVCVCVSQAILALLLFQHRCCDLRRGQQWPWQDGYLQVGAGGYARGGWNNQSYIWIVLPNLDLMSLSFSRPTGGGTEESHPSCVCQQTGHGASHDTHWGGQLPGLTCTQRQEVADLQNICHQRNRTWWSHGMVWTSWGVALQINRFVFG